MAKDTKSSSKLSPGKVIGGTVGGAAGLAAGTMVKVATAGNDGGLGRKVLNVGVVYGSHVGERIEKSLRKK